MRTVILNEAKDLNMRNGFAAGDASLSSRLSMTAERAVA
jgi:hypothetical protein